MSALWNLFERIVLGILKFLFRLAGKALTDEAGQAFMQFVKFALVGVTNTIVSYFINAAVLFSFGKAGLFPDHDIYIANTAAFILSVLWAYFLSNRFVFKEDESKQKRVWWKTLLKTYAAYAFTGLVLSNVISYVGVKILGLNKYIPPLINLVVSVPINYVLNKFWAYGQKEAQ